MTVLDTWPPGSCSLAKMQAYKRLETQNLIKIIRVEFSMASERLKITYDAPGMDSTQIHVILMDEARRIERDTL